MKNFKILVALIFSIFLCLNALHSQTTDNNLKNANLNFTFSCYKALRANGENTFFSPFSISTALSMTASGAANDTKKEMLKVLGTSNISDIELQQKNLLEAINSLAASSSIELKTANSLWLSNQFKIREDYQKTISENYLSEINSCDFTRSKDLEREKINLWVSEKTKGKILNLIPQDAITPLTRLILVNAIYFYGQWDIPFNIKVTKEDYFYPSESKSAKAQFMSFSKEINYFENEYMKAIELNYRDRKLSLIVILPQEENIESLAAKLDADLYREISSELRAKTVNLKLPKFRLENMYLLKDVLSKMGMPLAFDQNKSDFSGIDPKNSILISEVIHKSFVEVNEKGSEAAAATAIEMLGRGFPAKIESLSFVANRPFIFLIRDKVTDTILFLGELHHP